MADLQPTDTAHMSKDRKRTRVQLSCTACRSRKLKCCRTHPCTNCLKRREGNLCTFVGRGPRGRSSHGRASPTHVQDRLQHLENLIMSFAQQKKQEEPHNQENSSSYPLQAPELSARGQQMVLTPPSPPKLEGTSPEREDSPTGGDGKLLVKDTVTNYIYSAHWKAILEEINEFKQSIQENDDLSDDEEFIDEDSSSGKEPTIWFGISKPTSKEELLSDMPVRQVTDRLVSYYLISKEPIVTILHIPTFQKEYNKFWSNPQDVSLPWLGMLYAIMTLSTMFYQRTGDPIHGLAGDYSEIASIFRKRSAQCLVQSNYIAAGRYKVEALFLYTMSEFYKKHDVETGVPFLLGITIKLAMRSGYHRDPSQFPAISAFDGEMRRRTWAFLCQLDALLSFEVGVPRTLQDWQFDTELPRNLMDEDFNEKSLQLPPSRPMNEITTSTYVIAKSRIMFVFGKILDMAFSRRPVTYEETLEVDRQLEEANSLKPPAYHIRPMNQCIADSPELIFQRFTLANVYQKARCVLHRRYLGEVHTNMRYAYSRVVCITAAKQILRVHADLYREIQPGGLMYRNRLFPNSIQYTDYLLAAMILCMELSYSHATMAKAMKNDDVTVVTKDREELISTLENSHQILHDLRKQSADAQKAHAALTIMLGRIKRGLHTIPPPRTNAPITTTAPQPTEVINEPPPYDTWPSLDAGTLENPLFSVSANMAPEPIPTMDTQYASLDVIGEMLDTPANIDWQLWDQHIQNRPNHVMNGNELRYGH